jgi:hypothetical protein
MRLVFRRFEVRAMAQAVSHWLATEAAWVRAPVWSSGICGGQSGAGAGFLRVLLFPLPNFVPSDSPSTQSPGACTIGQKWPTCRVDPLWTPPPTMQTFLCSNLSRNTGCTEWGSPWFFLFPPDKFLDRTYIRTPIPSKSFSIHLSSVYSICKYGEDTDSIIRNIYYIN